MNAMRTGTLAVPGADLYYQVRGSGPVLLIIGGGAGAAEHAADLAGHLAAGHTVLTYDRRGLSRSTRQPTDARPTITTHADDAHRLLAAVGDGPATVLGCSFGALVGLALVARRPEAVRTLVAHEPPALNLLPDTERAAAARVHDDIEDTYRREGAAATMPKLLAMIGVDLRDRQPPAPSPRPLADVEFFLTNDFPAIRDHHVDVPAVRRAPTRIVPAAGRAAPDRTDRRCAVELARRLDVPLAEFPGGHAGATTHPGEFAAALREIG